jgi:hypothetical protein
MRLPTKQEALAITPRNECGWPETWYTWTSTEAGPGRWWFVGRDGDSTGYGGVGDVIIGTLCVRGGRMEIRTSIFELFRGFFFRVGLR